MGKSSSENLKSKTRAELLDELALYLRPPGQGIFAVSSGKAELEAFTKSYLGYLPSEKDSWRKHLEKLPDLKGKEAVALLAIPSDCGAGIMRGASRGPEAIRAALKLAPCFDLGDIFCVPHFIDDEMLSDAQMSRARHSIYPQLADPKRQQLPVSPLTMASRAYRLIRALNPGLRILLLGGDHTVAWPALEVLLEENQNTAIVHFDAHTDLLPERLGVKYCFATWAYHANEILGRQGRLVQIGIRASGRSKTHWESELGVYQIWADEALRLTPAALADQVILHLKKMGTQRVYVSNDLDGTDAFWAAACGTPEPKGLTPDHVTAVIDRLKKENFDCIGADVVELAPGLSLSQEASERSVQTAVTYLRHELDLLQNSRSL